MFLWIKRSAFAGSVMLIMVIWGMFVFSNLNRFSVADEQLWIYDRIPTYWKAWKHHNWAMTAINDKPGITLSIFSGCRLFFVNNFRGLPDAPGNATNPSEKRVEQSLAVNNFFRQPMVLANGIFLLIIGWLFKELWGKRLKTLIAFSAVALSPVLIGISQIVNPDTFLWSTGFAAFLAYWVFLRQSKARFIFISGLFLGLAILSKYTATIFYPFFFVLTWMEFFFSSSKIDSDHQPKRLRCLWTGYLTVITISIIIVALGMPASLFDRQLLFKSTLGYPGMLPIILPMLAITLLTILISFTSLSDIFYHAIFEKFLSWIGRIIFLSLIFLSMILVLNFYFGQDILHLNALPFDFNFFHLWSRKLPLIKKALWEMRPIVFSVLPLVLIGAIWIWAKSIFKKTAEFHNLIILSSFILVFISAVIQKDLIVTVRYSILLYPFLLTLGALGLQDMFAFFWPKIGSILAFASILVFSSLSLYLIKPFYFNYTNFFLPKSYLISDAWGQGGYKAAEYLNQLPNALQLTVWTDYYGVCDYFVGRCIGKTAADQVNVPVDYLVLTRRGYIRYLEREISLGKKRKPYPIKEYYQKNNPVWELDVDGRVENYTKIFKIE